MIVRLVLRILSHSHFSDSPDTVFDIIVKVDHMTTEYTAVYVI